MTQPIIVAQLGSGGMADVFLAMRRGIGGFIKLVVIKRLRTGAMEGDAVAMFHDEARLSARLNHPNVVQTHAAGFDGEHYRLEMEYLDGQPLHRIVSRAKKAGRAIDPSVAVAVVREVLAGLAYAHQLCDYDGSPLGIVHRDVSPQNVFVTYDGSVKLVDFGIAKAAGQASITQLGMVKGKIRYMAPEQATGGHVDHRVDVFAAGVVLWQLLVGRGYWGEVDDIAIFHMLARGEMPPSPRAVNADVPEALDRICTRALARDPDERYATAAELSEALAAHAPDGPGARALGHLAADLFSDVRASVRSAIEATAARPADAADDELETQVIGMSSSDARAAFRRVEGSERPVSGAVPIPAPPSRRSALVLTAAALCGLLALALFVASSRRWREPAPSLPSTVAAVRSDPVTMPSPTPALPERTDPDPRPIASIAPISRRASPVAPVRPIVTATTVIPHGVVDAGAPALVVAAPVSTRPKLDDSDMWDAARP